MRPPLTHTDMQTAWVILICLLASNPKVTAMGKCPITTGRPAVTPLRNGDRFSDAADILLSETRMWVYNSVVEYIQYTCMSPMDLQLGMKGNALGDVLNLLFPNHCYFCGVSLSSGVCICPGCSASLEIIEGDVCARCGSPLGPDNIANGKGCRQCAELKFLFGRNVSLGIFDGFLRRLVHLYKFEGRRSLYRAFTGLLLTHRRAYINQTDLLVPVPLSPVRYAERGFNQSHLLARSVARRVHAACYGSALCRRGNAAPQSSVSSQHERITNLTDRFRVRAGFGNFLQGKRVLLIDDVLTTGVTASACAKALFSAGAGSVDVLTLARSLKASGALYLSADRPIMK